MTFFWQILFLSLIYSTCHSSDIVSAPIKYDGKELVLDFPANYDNARLMALKFCREKLNLIDNTPEKVNCVKTLSTYLEREVEKFLQKNGSPAERKPETTQSPTDRTVKAVLNIAGNPYEITYNPAETNAVNAASQFCTKHLSTFDITAADINRCIEPVSTRLLELEKENQPTHSSQQTQSQYANPTPTAGSSPSSSTDTNLSPPAVNPNNQILTVTLNIQGTNFEVKYDPLKETAVQAATVFCKIHAAQWGITTDTFDKYCVQPIAAQLIGVGKKSKK